MYLKLGVVVAAVPWALHGSRFTSAFEGYYGVAGLSCRVERADALVRLTWWSVAVFSSGVVARAARPLPMSPAHLGRPRHLHQAPILCAQCGTPFTTDTNSWTGFVGVNCAVRASDFPRVSDPLPGVRLGRSCVQACQPIVRNAWRTRTSGSSTARHARPLVLSLSRDHR